MSTTAKWLFVSGCIVFFILLYLLSPMLTPFFLGALLAYLLDPIVNRLQAWKLPRTLAVTIVFIVFFAIITVLLLILIPLLEKQISELIASLPKIQAWLQDSLLPWLNLHFDTNLSFDTTQLQQTLGSNWQQAGGIASGLWKTISQSTFVIIAWLTNVVLTPVVMFYLLRDWDHVLDNVRGLLPRRIEPTVVKLFNECDEVLSAFLRGQLMVMIALGVLYSVGLSIIGINLALLIGMVAGLVSIVPYLGFIIGIVAAGIASFFQFHDAIHLGYVVLVFAIAQGIEGMLLTPLFVGDKIGLHPVAVIFAVLAGGELFGFIGILLALPVAAVSMVFVRFFKQHYENSSLYGTTIP